MNNQLVQYGVTDIYKMAQAFAASKLFGISTPEQAMALCLIAQAEGCHPATAMRDYQLIQGKPSLKADAMLARFQSASGTVEWHEMSDARVAAKFSHPAGGTIEIDWDIKRATTAGLAGKDNWKKYPRQMLRARVISEGVRTVFPGVTVGTYTPEEVQDFEDEQKPKQNFTGKTIENTPPAQPEPVKMPRDEREKTYDAILAEINGAADIETLAKVWASHGRTVPKLDEDLRVDLVQKKDECKEELMKAASGIHAEATVTE